MKRSKLPTRRFSWVRVATLVGFGLALLTGWQPAYAQEAEGELPVYRVTHTNELLAAIGSNRIIELAPGVYQLQDVLVLRDVENLELRGTTVPRGPGAHAHLLQNDKLRTVLQIVNGRNVRISHVLAGHTVVETGCAAGVIEVRDSSDVTVTHSHLYGSGSFGIMLNSVQGFLLESSAVVQCSQTVLMVADSTDVRISGSEIGPNEVIWEPVAISNSQVTITRSIVHDNQTNERPLFELDADSHLLVGNSVIRDNSVGRLTNNTTSLVLERVEIDGKLQDVETDGEGRFAILEQVRSSAGLQAVAGLSIQMAIPWTRLYDLDESMWQLIPQDDCTSWSQCEEDRAMCAHDADLNSDGVSELRLSAYCDAADPSHLVYVNEEMNWRPILEASGATIRVLDHQNNGFHDILTHDHDRDDGCELMTHYEYDGSVYVQTQEWLDCGQWRR